MNDRYDDALWRMWEAARSESVAAQQMMHSTVSWAMAAIAAIIAAISFLVDSNVSADQVRLAGWLAILFLGLLAGTQYMMEAKRMLRAGRFAFEIEKKALLMGLTRIPSSCLWEHHLLGMRFMLSYQVAAAATIGSLILAQTIPFLVYPAKELCLGSSVFWPWLLPIGGAALMIGIFGIDYWLFRQALTRRWGPDWK